MVEVVEVVHARKLMVENKITCIQLSWSKSDRTLASIQEDLANYNTNIELTLM